MSINKLIMVGRLSKDPELRITQDGKSVASLTLAVNRIKKGEADFIPCVAWEKKAEVISTYCTKGSQIAVTGRIQTRSWDDKDGNKRYVTECIVEDVQLLDSKKESAQQGTVDNGADEPGEDANPLPF